MKKLIFILENFFTKREFDKYEIQFFLDNKINVEIWDITEFTNVNFNKLIKPKDEIEGNFIKKIKNYNELKNAFDNLSSESLIAAYISLNINNFLVFKLLSKYKVDYFTRSGASITHHPQFAKQTFKKKIKFFFKKRPRLFIQYFLNFFLKITPFKMFGISNVPIYFKDSKVADIKKSLSKKLLGKNTKIILSHHRDYDVYLKCKNNNENKNKCDAVFLDVNFGFHNDYITYEEHTDPKKWYESLQVFFDFLKEKYAINTTVCAHPRSNGEINNLIKGYPIIKNKTPDMVKNCNFVMCQSSTAINFAALFKKPLIFIYNHVAINSNKSKVNHAGQVDFFAKQFNKRPINIENLKNFDLKKELEIDKSSYNEFISKYIKSWGTDQSQGEMIFDLLKT